MTPPESMIMLQQAFAAGPSQTTNALCLNLFVHTSFLWLAGAGV